jgi:hypothetical protein
MKWVSLDDHGSEPRTDSAQAAPTMTSTPRNTSSFAIEKYASGASTAVIAALLLGATGCIYSRLLFTRPDDDRAMPIRFSEHSRTRASTPALPSRLAVG